LIRINKMTKNSDQREVTIDATGQALGRVASRAAAVLRGKDRSDFTRHLAPGIKVLVTNVSKLKLTAKKLKAKSYSRYSGYPGGLKFRSLAEVIAKKGSAEPLRLAIRGMLPANKLRPRILKNLTIND